MENGLLLEYRAQKITGKRKRKKTGNEIRKTENPVKSRLSGFTKVPLITI